MSYKFIAIPDQALFPNDGLLDIFEVGVAPPRTRTPIQAIDTR